MSHSAPLKLRPYGGIEMCVLLLLLLLIVGHLGEIFPASYMTMGSRSTQEVGARLCKRICDQWCNLGAAAVGPVEFSHMGTRSWTEQKVA